MRSHRLSSKFLMLTVPAIVAVALALFGGLSWLKWREQGALNRVLAEQQAQRDATLIAGSLWNIDRDGLHGALESLSKGHSVHCVQLIASDDFFETLVAGDCGQADGLAVIRTDIHYLDAGQERVIGQLEHWIDVSVVPAEIAGQLTPLLIQLAAVVVVLVFATLAAFRRIVKVPLNHVRASVRAYQRLGQRVPVEWNSDDELGKFIREYNAGLARQAAAEQALAEAKQRAEEALADLQHTQASLVESEKLASLGGLVAGVAHEINTPLGVALTSVSHLKDRTAELRGALAEGKLRKPDLEGFISDADESEALVERNLVRTAELVRSFKEVAVSEHGGERRQFRVAAAIADALAFLDVRLQAGAIRVSVDCDAELTADSYPGTVVRILSQLIENAVLHAFSADTPGAIDIAARSIETEPHAIELSIHDNGRGIPTDQLSRVFEPFFTTRRGQGGTGLGLHVCYNLAVQQLKGSLRAESSPGLGTRFLLKFAQQAS